MANTERVYSRVVEAEEIVKKLCEKQPDVLWCVRPDNVIVLGIENKERNEKNKTLAKVRPIKGCEKAILQLNNIPIRYAIELYWSDWHVWKEPQKQWIILHELLHIHQEIGKTIKHDCEDFQILIDKVGVRWFESDKLPNLLNDDVKFNLELRPSLEEEDGETDNIDEDEEKKAKRKAKKERDEAKAKEVQEAKSQETPNNEKPKDGSKGPF